MFAAAFLVTIVLVVVLGYFRFCAKEAGEQQTTQQTTTQQAARYQQAQNPAILATALLVFVVLVFVLVLLPGPQSRRRCPRCPSRPVTCGRTSPAAPCARRGDWQHDLERSVLKPPDRRPEARAAFLLNFPNSLRSPAVNVARCFVIASSTALASRNAIAPPRPRFMTPPCSSWN
jgi:ABC-type Fe3+ transport system permease subunit